MAKEDLKGERAIDPFLWNAWEILVTRRSDKKGIMGYDVLRVTFASVKLTYHCGKGRKWSFITVKRKGKDS